MKVPHNTLFFLKAVVDITSFFLTKGTKDHFIDMIFRLKKLMMKQKSKVFSSLFYTGLEKFRDLGISQFLEKGTWCILSKMGSVERCSALVPKRVFSLGSLHLKKSSICQFVCPPPPLPPPCLPPPCPSPSLPFPLPALLPSPSLLPSSPLPCKRTLVVLTWKILK